jgi:hypothetical protein
MKLDKEVRYKMDSNIYKRNIVYRIRTISSRNILFGDNQCFELNELALIIWNNLNGENTIEDLVIKISEEYDADKETVRQDVLDFINGMVNKNVILRNQIG